MFEFTFVKIILRVFACYGADADDVGETKIDEGVVLKTILDQVIELLLLLFIYIFTK